MLIGHAGTSTLDQRAGLEAQKRELAAADCEKVARKRVSSVAVVAREKPVEALEFLRDGDVLVVTKLDRLARLKQCFIRLQSWIAPRLHQATRQPIR
jgi:DNA invertase Pin-like site-specific DNA recombinase